MVEVTLEHANITVSDPKSMAKMLCDIFDWTIRWQGEAKDNGVSYHVGGPNSYLALYSKGGTRALGDTYETPGAMNHIGVVVSDIQTAEERVRAAGFTPHQHDDYDPGVRFYFKAQDGIEIEVVSYKA